MRAKEYLEQIKMLNAHIDAKIADVHMLRSIITKITPTLRDDPVSGGGSQDKLSETICKIVVLEEEINKEIDDLVNLKRSITKTLDLVNDPDQFSLLYKRYFEEKSFEQIACEMYMSYRNVCYIHGKALQSVERILHERSVD